VVPRLPLESMPGNGQVSKDGSRQRVVESAAEFKCYAASNPAFASAAAAGQGVTMIEGVHTCRPRG
jgi:hypothetical protein